ncbi:MAG: GIY-YIG nuclease family protein [Clostridia bacterium]|nr:GIY-YIG nuclease family protein [Clostridia bacterium]
MYVYIMASFANRVLYIGVTGDLKRRVHEHKNKLNEGFTSKYNVTKLLYYEQISDPNAAIAREKQLKGWTRTKKLALIQEKNPMLLDLAKELK